MRRLLITIALLFGDTDWGVAQEPTSRPEKSKLAETTPKSPAEKDKLAETTPRSPPEKGALAETTPKSPPEKGEPTPKSPLEKGKLAETTPKLPAKLAEPTPKSPPEKGEPIPKSPLEKGKLAEPTPKLPAEKDKLAETTPKSPPEGTLAETIPSSPPEKGALAEMTSKSPPEIGTPAEATSNCGSTDVIFKLDMIKDLGFVHDLATCSAMIVGANLYIISNGEGEGHTRARWWFHADYLLWWSKDGPLPVPLVTASPSASFGTLGQPGTTVLFGDSTFDYGPFSGGRFTLGGWLNGEKNLGLEGNLLFLGRRSAQFFAGGDGTGDSAIARPIVNVPTGAETSLLIAFPSAFSGGVGVSSSSRLWGAELNLRGKTCCEDWYDVNLLAGFRYADLTEDIGIRQISTLLPGGASFFNGAPLPVAAIVTLQDRFGARNQFYGGQIGVETELRRGRWFLDMLGKLALGSSHEVVTISGDTTVHGAVPTATAPGGLLALPTNIGRQSGHAFAVIPEVGVTLGFQMTHRCRASLGYSFLYWSDVVRPGDQITRVVNPAQLPSSGSFGPLLAPAEPAPRFEHADYWAQGINFGLSFRY